MNVLIWEDLPDGSLDTCSWLSSAGVEYSVVRDAEELDKRFEPCQFDLFLVDISSTSRSGLDALWKIQSLESQLPVVVYSIHKDENLSQEFLVQGAQDYISKDGAECDHLLKVMRYAISRNRVAVRKFRQENMIRSVLEDSYDAFIALDCNLNILEWNYFAEKTFGWRREEIIGKDLSFIVPKHRRRQFLKGLRKFFGANSDCFLKMTRQILARDNSGRYFPAEFAVFRLDSNPKITYFAFLRDVTEAKRTKEELERLVHARTEELRRSNDELRQFAKIASHDLQEPLRAISGFANLLAKSLKGKLDSNTTDFIDFILDGTERMKLLIQSILIHSQLGTCSPIDQVTDTNSVVNEVLNDMRSLIDDTGTSIEVDQLPEVAVERSQLLQLFQNLISNSIKYRSTELTPSSLTDQFLRSYL